VGIKLSGWGGAVAKYNLLANAINEMSDEERWVGTTAPGSIFGEFGTSRQRSFPAFRPAIREGKAFWNKAPMPKTLRRTVTIFKGGDILDTLAELIVEKSRLNTRRVFKPGSHRTGAAERGWAWGKTVAEMAAKSKANQPTTNPFLLRGPRHARFGRVR
jgi:hypothetical protein